MATAKQMINKGVGIVVGITVTVLLVAYVLIPVGLDTLATADMSNLSSGTEALLSILGVISALVVMLVFIGWAMDAFDT